MDIYVIFFISYLCYIITSFLISFNQAALINLFFSLSFISSKFSSSTNQSVKRRLTYLGLHFLEIKNCFNFSKTKLSLANFLKY